MNIKPFLKELDFSVPKDEKVYLENQTEEVFEKLKSGVRKSKLKADVFIGGSFAKETLMHSEEYDIDIFIRFSKNYEDLSDYLSKIIEISFEKEYKIERIHGSRDYFKIWKDKKIVFEVIPVLSIKHPREEKNVTDLSYFHVHYVKRKTKGGKINREIRLAKKFCKANGFYGAESYIQGFSGYGLECLMIYYGSFERFVKEMIKVKSRLVIDPEKVYKKGEVELELNESKLQSPIILVDPSWKERNVLAALSKDTFEKFQEKLREFVKRPDISFFERREVDEILLKAKAKKNKGEFLKIRIKTDKQEGDIAGTKLKKFSNFLQKEIEKFFDVLESEFDYDLGSGAIIYLVLKSKGEIVRKGPPVKMEKHARAFRKENNNVFEKNGKLYCKVKVAKSGKKFVKDWLKKRKNIAREMGIVGVKI